MKVISLASGSSGNAYCVEACGEVLLIDCGISCRQLVHRCHASGVDASSITAVVFTHNHEDHVRGLSTLHSRFPNLPLFANMMTAEAIALKTGIEEDAFSVFENSQTFDIGVFSITPFSIPHDVPDPVGFLVSAEGKSYFHATDVGTPLDSIGGYMAKADIVTIESNHDPILLEQSQRPDMLKRRIRGQRGHLSNDDAAYLVKKFASSRLKKIFLAHLSGECNAPHIAEETMAGALREAGMVRVPFETLCPDRPISFSC